MPQAQRTISLTVKLPDGSTKTKEFSLGDSVMVGSGAGAHIRLPSEGVSSLHCMFKSNGDKLTVVDLGSDEGTFRNGVEVAAETVVNDGDLITVGKCQIRIHSEGVELPPTTPSAAPAEITALKNSPPMVSMDASPPSAPPIKKAAKAPAAVSAAAPIAPKATSVPKSTHGVVSQIKSGIQDLSAKLTASEKPSDKSTLDVTALWNGTAIEVNSLKTGKKTELRIGPADSNDVVVQHTSIGSVGSHIVAKMGPQGAVLNALNGMELFIDKNQRQSGSVTLELGQVGVVRVGNVDFVAQYRKPNPVMVLPWTQTMDYFYARILAMGLIIGLGIMAVFILTPKSLLQDDDDLLKNMNEFTKLILTAQEKKEEKKEDAGAKPGEKAKGDEGKFGKKDKPQEDKAPSKKGAPNVDKDKREEDRKLVSDTLAQLGLTGGPAAFSDVAGPGGIGTGVNNALGGLKGSGQGDAGGAGGLGMRGTGGGGGGNGLGIGNGLGGGRGYGNGTGDVDLGGRGKGKTRIVPGKVIYAGGLSKEEIERVIARVMSQIKFCYEKELTKDPNLQGNVAIQWTITGGGDVTGANASKNTLNDTVGTCVSRTISRLKFPQPKGGGQVIVTYPFVFSPSGG